MTSRREPDPATVAVALGRGPGVPGDPLNVPPILASVYRAPAPVEYGRERNPTWEALEEVLGALEGGSAVVFGSGMATIAALLDTLPAQCAVVFPRDAYLGTRRLLGELERSGRLEIRPVDTTDDQATLAACSGAAMLWLESPTNPMMAVPDLARLCRGARNLDVRTVVDNTFATPVLQRPLDLGADVALHSLSKFLSGHSDLLMGAAVTRDAELLTHLRRLRTQRGAIPGPFEAWLALRGIRTLVLRVERAQANAAELARRLAAHPAVSRVRYPGLPEDPGHERASAQMCGFGAMISFELHGGPEAADAVCESVRLAVHASSLGGVQTTLERRNRQPGDEEVPPALIRLSVGCEHIDDLWADFEQALPR